MRIAVVQFAPQIVRVQENIDKAHELCDRLRPNSVDLVCLPEMIFTGYVFPDATAISPYLEEPRSGPTSQFCASLAARLCCYVVAGYPERLRPEEVASKGHTKENQAVGANSAVLYGPHGAYVGHYRKTNLYETDMTWAQAGTGFTTFYLPPPLNTVSLGICMDLNPQPPALWDSISGPYEVADYCMKQKTTLLVLLNAWLDSKADPEQDTDWQTINYWAMRLRPLWAPVSEVDEFEGDDTSTSDTGRKHSEELLVVVCNRCGEENGVTFAGSSSLFILQRGTGRPTLLHAMKRRQEDVQVWTYPSN